MTVLYIMMFALYFYHYTGPCLMIFRWRGNYKKGPQGKKRKGGSTHFMMPWGHTEEHFCIFELPRLDFLQFQHDFGLLSDQL